MVLSGGREVDLPHLPPSIVGAEQPTRVQNTTHAGAVRPLHLALREFERDYVLRALRAADGKRTRTAELLGISRKTLWEKLRQEGASNGRPLVDQPMFAEEEGLA
jgi:DNA-binding NtrC family response regulator